MGTALEFVSLSGVCPIIVYISNQVTPLHPRKGAYQRAIAASQSFWTIPQPCLRLPVTTIMYNWQVGIKHFLLKSRTGVGVEEGEKKGGHNKPQLHQKSRLSRHLSNPRSRGHIRCSCRAALYRYPLRLLLPLSSFRNTTTTHDAYY